MHRQVKSPSLVQDLLMLGDLYLTLAWLALRRRPLWPSQARWNRPTAPVAALMRAQERQKEAAI
ncbi:hypothetical protein LCGC14_2388200 [marine sediment metagenome]|uniref:Uncharacterized protein n=1 Tax=marine sediment metagenome TaxID=412755 RepID=A0A0F9EB76_9ZZZZ